MLLPSVRYVYILYMIWRMNILDICIVEWWKIRKEIHHLCAKVHQNMNRHKQKQNNSWHELLKMLRPVSHVLARLNNKLRDCIYLPEVSVRWCAAHCEIWRDLSTVQPTVLMWAATNTPHSLYGTHIVYLPPFQLDGGRTQTHTHTY